MAEISEKAVDMRGESVASDVTPEAERAEIEVPTGAVLVLLPEEQPHLKSLRQVVDKIFLCRDQFMITSARYTDMYPGEEGVNRYLRSMLFMPSRQLKRGVKRSEVMLETTARNEGISSAVKQTQRRSKQKERCENKLMSLLFAAIYDPATKHCKLVHGAPPLQLRRPDKNGLYRNVSNYTDVRMFLRNAMSAILACYTDAVNILGRLLPNSFSILPTMFTLLGRTFMLILSCSGKVSEEQSAQCNAMTALDGCFDSIQNFIVTWERRNYTRDNPLPNCFQAGNGSDYYEAIRTLLRAMIALLPPTGIEPFSSQFRERNIYSFGVRSGTKCQQRQRSDQQCLLSRRCEVGTASHSGTTTDLFESSLACVDALVDCSKMAHTNDDYEIDGELNTAEFPPSALQSACDSTILHQLYEERLWVARLMLSLENAETRNDQDIRMEVVKNFSQRIQFDVARCWAALGRSNIPAARILEGLCIKDRSELKNTIIELVFGGGLAAVSLFERESKIIPICVCLAGKRGQVIMEMNHGAAEEQTTNGPGEREVVGEAMAHRNSNENEEATVGSNIHQSAAQGMGDSRTRETTGSKEADSRPSKAGANEEPKHQRTQPRREIIRPPRRKKRRGTITQTVEAAKHVDRPSRPRKRPRASNK